MTEIAGETTALEPILREVSGRIADTRWGYFFDAGELPHHILRSEGFQASGAHGYFELLDEMEEKDGHLFAVLQTRKNGVLSCPRKVVAASESPRDQRIARFVQQALKRVRGLDQSLLNILDALGKGLSIQEIIWEMNDGKVCVRDIKSRAPGRFLLASDGTLRLASHDAADLALRAAGVGRATRETVGISRTPFNPVLPERKFIRFTFGGLYENPYGRGLCSRAYWYYWFKKNNLKFWAIYNEKFGTPTVVGKYRPGTSEEDRNRLFEVVESLQNDTGVTIPESVSIQLLEAQRSGNATTYREMADWCNDEISKIVIGATLTASEGRRSGSQALGKVHERVRSEYIEADARALEDIINSQLIRWLVDFNFGIDVDAPRWNIDTTRDDQLEHEMLVDRQLIEVGVRLPESYFYEKYQRPAPIGQEPALRFDDRDLFQYHLRYGVLTINEARARLGLPAVAWGEVRASGTDTSEPAYREPREGSDGIPKEQEGQSEEEPREL